MAYLMFRQFTKQGWVPAAYDTNETFQMWNVEIGELVGACFARIEAAFNGTSPTGSVGDGDDVDRFMTTTNMGVATTGLKRGTGAGFTETLGYLYTAQETIDITFVAATGSPTTGRMSIWAYIARIEPR